MTVTKCLLVVLLFASIHGTCQESILYSKCNERAKTQSEMNFCANQKAARADEQLNQVYRKLLSQTAMQTGVAEKVKDAERAWIVYRDAYVDAMYPAKDKQAEYGSIYPMEADLVRAKLTRRHVAALRELLEHYSGEEHSGGIHR